jgi:hypothetical protein
VHAPVFRVFFVSLTLPLVGTVPVLEYRDTRSAPIAALVSFAGDDTIERRIVIREVKYPWETSQSRSHSTLDRWLPRGSAVTKRKPWKNN